MLEKPSKLYSILTGSCPKCGKDNMYIEKNPYIISKVLDMHDNCSNCGLHYKMEPSFFYGAMYVSYAVSVAFGIATFIISFVILESTILTAFFAIVLSLVIFFPVILRLSRNIWINIFV